jgi:amidase
VSIEAITDDTLRAAAARWGIDPELALSLRPSIERMRHAYERIQALAGRESAVSRPRVPVTMLNGTAQDPYGAWMYRIDDSQPGCDGPLTGRTVVVKDSVAVRGVPMTLGSRLLQSFIPSSDAAVVRRLREAGAEILGTSVCEDLCYSGSSFTSAYGPVRNPWDPGRASGGSSSGPAVLVASAGADIGVGTDLGGSVRNPASWCGIIGLKPTFGLVDYDGAMPTERTMDTIGFLTRQPELLPIILDATTQNKGHDPGLHASGYAQPITGLRAGVLTEGFGWERSDPRVDDIVRQSALALRELGIGVDEVSVPLHRNGPDIHLPISVEGGLTTVFETYLQGNNHVAEYHADLAAAFGDALVAHPDYLAINAAAALLGATVLRQATHGAIMAQAQRLRGQICRQVRAAFIQHDVLVLPTTPMLAHQLPDDPQQAALHGGIAFQMHDNNCVFNLTGHPALSVPCGFVDGLPVGMLLVGRHDDDARLARIATEFAKRIFAGPSPPAISTPKKQNKESHDKNPTRG